MLSSRRPAAPHLHRRLGCCCPRQRSTHHPGMPHCKLLPPAPRAPLKPLPVAAACARGMARIGTKWALRACRRAWPRASSSTLRMQLWGPFCATRCARCTLRSAALGARCSRAADATGRPASLARAACRPAAGHRQRRQGQLPAPDGPQHLCLRGWRRVHPGRRRLHQPRPLPNQPPICGFPGALGSGLAAPRMQARRPGRQKSCRCACVPTAPRLMPVPPAPILPLPCRTSRRRRRSSTAAA